MTIKELIIKLINEVDIRDLDEEIVLIRYNKTKTGYELEIKTEKITKVGDKIGVGYDNRTVDKE